MRAMTWRLAAVVVLVLAGLGGQALFAQEAVDRRVHQALQNTIKEAVRHYDADRFAECCAAFRAGLVTVQAFLEHRPALQAEIRRGTADAERETSHYRRAWALRGVIDHVQDTLIPPPPPPILSLWERLGGEEGVRKIVNDWIDAAIADPKVNFSRNGQFPMDARRTAELKRKLFQLASAATGGPDKVYLGKTMKAAHKGMGITDAEFDAMLGHLKLALLSHNVQDKDMQIILSAIKSIARPDIVDPSKDKPDIVAPGKVEPGKPVTLWDRLGGQRGVEKIAHDFVNGALSDPKVNLNRNGQHKIDAAELERKLVILASSVGGGPHKYAGKTMADIHRGMQITDAEFDATLGHLKVALVKNEVKPEDQELILAAIETTRKDIVEKKNAKPQQRPQAAAPVEKKIEAPPVRPERSAPEAALPGPGSKTLDALVPADAELVIQANLKQFFSSSLFEKHLRQRVRDGLGEDWEQFKKDAGLDPLKDLDSITLTAAGETKTPRILVVLRGKFDAAKINVALEAHAKTEKGKDLKSSKEGRLTIWEAQNDKNTMYTTVASPTAIVMSPEKAYLIKGVNDEGRNQPNPDLKTAAGKIPAQESFWLVAVVTPEIKKQLAANKDSAKYADSLKAMTAALTVSGALQLNLQVQTNSPTVAEELKSIADQFKMVAAQLGALQAGEELAPLVQDILGKQLKINAEKTTLVLDLKVSEEQVQRLFDKLLK